MRFKHNASKVFLCLATFPWILVFLSVPRSRGASSSVTAGRATPHSTSGMSKQLSPAVAAKNYGVSTPSPKRKNDFLSHYLPPFTRTTAKQKSCIWGSRSRTTSESYLLFLLLLFYFQSYLLSLISCSSGATKRPQNVFNTSNILQQPGSGTRQGKETFLSNR